MPPGREPRQGTAPRQTRGPATDAPAQQGIVENELSEVQRHWERHPAVAKQEAVMLMLAQEQTRQRPVQSHGYQGYVGLHLSRSRELISRVLNELLPMRSDTKNDMRSDSVCPCPCC